MLVFLLASFGFTVTGIVLLYPAEGASPLVVGLSVLAFVFFIGIADWQVSKIVLVEERLEIVELFRQRSYRRSEFVSAKTDGGRVWLERSQGDWLILRRSLSRERREDSFPGASAHPRAWRRPGLRRAVARDAVSGAHR